MRTDNLSSALYIIIDFQRM